ncbi:MAG: hypothetical protein MN733_15915 [Nitrososphaera sp.]|nr:hypothetical protein [Nitrososphaera sp.]
MVHMKHGDDDMVVDQTEKALLKLERDMHFYRSEMAWVKQLKLSCQPSEAARYRKLYYGACSVVQALSRYTTRLENEYMHESRRLRNAQEHTE